MSDLDVPPELLAASAVAILIIVLEIYKKEQIIQLSLTNQMLFLENLIKFDGTYTEQVWSKYFCVEKTLETNKCAQLYYKKYVKIYLHCKCNHSLR